ncbi:hypothetical protein JYT79_00580 [Cardiobacterium sp. AH-315-I02]|nr:hypothetical protein [Cardiobacterium sp. AH-315-I02]
MRIFNLFAFILLVLLQACATSSDQQVEKLAPLYFPPPPEKPRYVFERVVQSSSQIDKKDQTSALREMLTGESSSAKTMAKPFDVAVCQGIIFVSDTVQRSVLVFDIPGKRFFEIGKDKPGTLRKPLGLDTDDSCNLYVADTTTSTIMVFDQTGRYINSLGGKEWFDRLTHVAVDGEGKRIYAVDTGGVGSKNHHVRVFDVATGKHLSDIGQRGDKQGELNLPRDIEVDDNGAVYVVDGGNFRVQIFNRDGDFVRQVGKLGRQYGHFARPKGIAINPQGNIFVSDAAHGNFQIFNPEGQLLLFVGSRSEKFERASYMLPAGIDIDEDGRVYMIDQYFRKLDVYRPVDLKEDEGFLGAWPVNSVKK